MKKLILAFIAVALVGCIADRGDDKEPKVLGYSVGGCVGACGKATGFNGLTAWELGEDSLGAIKFYVYAQRSSLTENPRPRTRTALQSFPEVKTILDAGSQCLTIHQTGKDTVALGGGTVVVDVPIEPCLPYLLDKDLP